MITTNTGAKKLESSDNWREIFPNPGTGTAGAHNATVDAQDRIQAEVAPIINGKQCALGAASGDYVLLRNSTITGKSDGAYIATKAIPANTDIDSTYLGNAITGGMVNELNSNLTKLSSYSSFDNAYAVLSDDEHGFAVVANPISGPSGHDPSYSYQVEQYRDDIDYGWQTARRTNDSEIFVRHRSAGSWSIWTETVLDDKAPEIVSNANGNAYKFPSGMMVCTKTLTINAACTNSWGSLYESQHIDLGSWPVQFQNGRPCVSISNAGGQGGWFEYVTDTTVVSVGKTYFIRPTQNTADVYIDIIGIGRWK